MTNDPVDLVRRFVNGYNERTLHDDAKTVFAPDLVVVEENTGKEVQGLEAWLAVYDDWLETVPDARWELLDHDIDGPLLTLQMRSGGTYTGKLDLGEETVQVDGREFAIDVRVKARVEDGQITRWSVLYDMEAFLEQLELA